MSDPRAGSDAAVARDGPVPERARPAYFGPAHRRAFGWYHPAWGGEGTVRDCAVVLCAPVAHETTGWHRALRHWAERLAASGVATLRFDYPGTGDSAGDDASPALVRAWVDSVGDAIDAVRNWSGVQHVALAGARIGATFALAAASERGDVEALILWAAFPTGRAHLREGRAFTRLMAPAAGAGPEGMEQIGGFVMSAATVAALDALDPLADGRSLTMPVLVLPREEGSNDAAFIARLRAAGADVERAVVGGYAGVMVDAHQSVVPRELIDATADWLGARFGVRTGGDRRLIGRLEDEDTLPLAPTRRFAGARDDQAGPIVEQPMHFGDRGGSRLFGVLSRPARGDRRQTGVVLVNSGAVSRVGPNGLYVALAREWASLGYTVLRMDVGGLGDSEVPSGALENHTYPDHAVSDVAAGVAALRAQGLKRVVVAGLCSGAHASFHAGLELDGVNGLLIINPIVFYWKPSDPLDVSAWVNYNELRHYKGSVLRADSWMRLLQGKVNVFYVARVGVTRLREIARAELASLGRRLRGQRDESDDAARDLERMAAKGTDLLLLFSAGDPGLDFLTLNYSRELRKLRRLPGFRLQVIDDADHTFTALEARRRAGTVLTEHLLARHP